MSSDDKSRKDDSRTKKDSDGHEGKTNPPKADKENAAKAEKDLPSIDASSDLAGGILDAILPGIGKVVNEIKNSEALRQKLDETNLEIERRIREGGQDQGASSVDLRTGGRHVDVHLSVRSLKDGKEFYSLSRGSQRQFNPQGGARKKTRPAIEVADILDQGKAVLLIIELRGINEKNLVAEIVKDNTIILKVIDENGKETGLLEKVELSSKIAKVKGRTFSNGVLELTLLKSSEEEEEKGM